MSWMAGVNLPFSGSISRIKVSLLSGFVRRLIRINVFIITEFHESFINT